MLKDRSLPWTDPWLAGESMHHPKLQFKINTFQSSWLLLSNSKTADPSSHLTGDGTSAVRGRHYHFCSAAMSTRIMGFEEAGPVNENLDIYLNLSLVTLVLNVPDQHQARDPRHNPRDYRASYQLAIFRWAFYTEVAEYSNGSPGLKVDSDISNELKLEQCCQASIEPLLLVKQESSEDDKKEPKIL